MGVLNLLGNIPTPLAEEVFQTLVQAGSCRLERIISHGQASPPDFWYDQTEHEWVLVLSGCAGLRLADQAETVVLRPGDSLNLPAGTRHRVEWTCADEPTVWLALHYTN